MESKRRGLPVLMLPILVRLLTNDRDRISAAVSSAVGARVAYANCPTHVAFGLRSGCQQKHAAESGKMRRKPAPGRRLGKLVS